MKVENKYINNIGSDLGKYDKSPVHHLISVLKKRGTLTPAHRHTPKWKISLLRPILANFLNIVDRVQAAVWLSMQLGNIFSC